MRFTINVWVLATMLAGSVSTSAQGAAASTATAFDGTSLASAVVIQATNEDEGVPAEYRWIRERFPGFKRGTQELINENGRFYDTLDITTASGEHKKFYFDITHVFGKM